MRALTRSPPRAQLGPQVGSRPTPAGAEGGLRDTYGLSAAELARLLNKVRAEQTGRF